MPDTTHPIRHFPRPNPKRKNQYSQPPNNQCQITDVPPLSNPHSTSGHEKATWTPQRAPSHKGPETQAPVLLRKEVIQPHLPVRLPCYDLTPITNPTFDGSFLTVRPPASGVTDFRGLTGGVYKARERIHPGSADPGLLATPTSCRRVAACNLN